jgi:acetyl esterase/lipase
MLLGGFIPPDPLAKLYTRSFFRATYVLTALDAGFFSAMDIKTKWIRDVVSVLFSLGYLLFPNQAHEKVKKYPTTVRVFRTAWEKSTNPYLYAIGYFLRGYLRTRRDVLIPRPTTPSPTSFHKVDLGPIKARLYFHGNRKELAKCTQLLFDVPGGGFTCMTPKNHDDYLSSWARKCKIPIISINYGKAPEHPYPWAIEECFDAYRSIVESNGECIGFDGWYELDSDGSEIKKEAIKIAMVGDSAGGNIVTAVLMKSLEYHTPVRLPCSLLLIYPCLSFDMACWFPNAHLDLLKSESTDSIAEIVRNKTELDLQNPFKTKDAPKSIDVITGEEDRSSSWYNKYTPKSQDTTIHTGLSMTSRFSFFSDRILNPECNFKVTIALRGMALMYLAESPLKPDFENDFYLSPLVAPNTILALFPKTYLICGEKDPLVDDTGMFA